MISAIAVFRGAFAGAFRRAFCANVLARVLSINWIKTVLSRLARPPVQELDNTALDGLLSRSPAVATRTAGAIAIKSGFATTAPYNKCYQSDSQTCPNCIRDTHRYCFKR